MKTIPAFIAIFCSTLLTLQPARAEDKCACMASREAKMKEMEKKMDGETAALQKLLDEMNSSTGDKKLEAMAALLNKMVQTHKEMQHKMMMQPSKPAAEAAPKADGQAPAESHEEHHH